MTMNRQFSCNVDIGSMLMEAYLCFTDQINMPFFYLYEIASIEAHKDFGDVVVYNFRDQRGEILFSAWDCIAEWNFKEIEDAN
jgi:hypothetical protein